MSIDQALRLLTSGSPLVLMAFFIVAAALGQIVFGWVYRAMVTDRDEWKAMAQALAKQNAQLLDVLESGKRGRG